MRIFARLDAVLLGQRGALFPWAPVFFAAGIGGFFVLRVEPGTDAYLVAALVAICSAFAALRWPSGIASLCWALCLVACGFGVAGLRAHTVAGPVLEWRYYGPVEGRIIGVDRSASDAVRLRLDQVWLARVPGWKTPDHIRISLHGAAPGFDLVPGQIVMTTGHLSPPGGPVEPGGFDFRRHAWFQGLGAVGYTRNPLLLAAPSNADLRLLRLRQSISARIFAVQGGDIGGFGAAVTTGDRSGVSREALEWLRASNTAHLLAISGLHMGLLVGVVFAALRYALALIPWLALRVSVRKIAAFGALLAAAAYLAVSGASVATERAFVMASVMLVAIMLDRRAMSLRSVAMAALVVLSLRPEALLGPGFQMSFAATTALVAVFAWLRDHNLSLPGPIWMRIPAGVLLSSAIAGFATAPVGAAHFNAVAHYGLLANLLSVPLMGSVVMPASVLAAVLAPFGLESVGLTLMGWGIQWILWVAEWVAGLDGARSFVPSPDPRVLPMLSIGALIVILWQGRARYLGMAPMIAAAALWVGTERPAVLIAEEGTLVGVMTQEGRALSKPRGAGFTARVWLENDGDRVSQDIAAQRWPGAGAGAMRLTLQEREIVHLTRKRSAAEFSECRQGQIIVSAHPLALSGPCTVLGGDDLKRSGSVSLSATGEMRDARTVSGDRVWNMRTLPPDRRAGLLVRRDQ